MEFPANPQKSENDVRSRQKDLYDNEYYYNNLLVLVSFFGRVHTRVYLFELAAAAVTNDSQT